MALEQTSKLAMRLTNLLLAGLLVLLNFDLTIAQDKGLELAKFVETQVGELPIILSAPHGGKLELEGVPVRTGDGLKKGAGGFVTARDGGTEELAASVSDAIYKQFGRRPYLVASKLHRKYLDPNRVAQQAYEDAAVKPIYEHYHQSLTKYCSQVAERFHCGIVLDIHGQGTKRDTVFRGTNNGLTVTSLRNRFGDSAISGPKSLFGLLQSRGWVVHPADLASKEQAGFTGGHIVQSYGSRHATPHDAIQLEFGAEYRVESRRAETAKVLADALAEYSTLYLNLDVNP